MKEIPLSRGLVALVDDEDFAAVSKFKWSAARANGGVYAVRGTTRRVNGVRKQRQFSIHRMVMGDPDGKQVDHINHDTLDCRKSNLRIATAAQNQWNRKGPQRNNTTGFRGVIWRKDRKTFIARLKVNGALKHLGSFPTKEMARSAYASANREYFGEFGGAA